RFKLYLSDLGAPATEIASASTPGIKPGMVISDKGNISFSLSGSALFFGVAPPAEPEKEEAEDASSDDKVMVDLWHWKDDYIQPMQKVRAERDRNRSFRAVFNLKEKSCLQLADESMAEANPSSDGRWALGSDNRGYRIMVGYDTDYSDYFLVNTSDGKRKPLFKKQQWAVSWSPGGKYGLFYDGKDWNTLSVPDGRIVNLTKNLGVVFSQEDHDSPSVPPSYGNGAGPRTISMSCCTITTTYGRSLR